MSHTPTVTSESALVPPDLRLLVLSDALDDLEDVRKRTENRYRALITPEITGERGGRFGKGVSPDDPLAINLLLHLEAIGKMERQAVKALEEAMRDHPLGPFVEDTHGLGFKVVARFLGAVGDLTTREHVSSVWAYCGLHVINPGQGIDETHDSHAGNGSDAQSPTGDHRTTGVAPRRRKGQKANWSQKAKMRAWNMAQAVIKANNPHYRAIYDERKLRDQDAVHAYECRNSVRPPGGSNGCGTVAHPEWGAVGSPLRPGHIRARAERQLAKEIIKDLWREAIVVA